MKTVVGLFDNVSDALDTVEELRDAGFSRDSVSLVLRDVDERYARDLDRDVNVVAEDEAAEGAAAGAVGGGLLGGLAGFLIGLGAFTVPGVGPIVAAGPIASAVAGAGIGAVAGGLLGALVGWGIPEAEAEYYVEGVRRGGTIVAVEAADDRAPIAAEIIERHGPVDLESRVETWRGAGWEGFERDASPYTVEEIRAERERYDLDPYR